MDINKTLRQSRRSGPGQDSQALETAVTLSAWVQKGQELLNQCLPPVLKDRVRLSLDRHHKAVLVARDGVAAGHLRMLMPAIENALRVLPPPTPGASALEGLIVKVRPQQKIPPAPTRRIRMSVSEETAEMLHSMAEESDDAEWREVLEKLAARSNKGS